jgi:parallel beta-helix repeat protein
MMIETMSQPSTRRRALRTGTLGVLLAASALLASACSSPTPEQLVRQEAPPNAEIDPAQPCTRDSAGGGAAPAEGGEPDARFIAATNTIELTGGEGVTLPALAEAVDDPDALQEVGEGEWELRADISVLDEASLHIAAPAVSWLKLVSADGKFASLLPFGGKLDISGTCITSWDPAANAADTNQDDGRGYLLARDGGEMNIDNAELRFLGSSNVESYGLSWRTEGTTGKITNSLVSHNYFGLYSYEVGGLVVTDNEFHDNSLYGIDPHTDSHDLVIERNVVHDNGKHGIILAEDCVDSVIRDNIVYRNKHHGIVLYLRSDRNTIEGNHTFLNAAQGININESNDSTVRGNHVYDNKESGIGIGQTSQNILVENNHSRSNDKDGIRVVTEAAQTTIRGNTLGGNSRYGIYVDIDGDVDIADNMIFSNRSGIMLKGSSAEPDDNTIFGNEEIGVLRD